MKEQEVKRDGKMTRKKCMIKKNKMRKLFGEHTDPCLVLKGRVPFFLSVTNNEQAWQPANRCAR